MNDESIPNLDDAYEKLMGDRRQEAWKTKETKAIEERLRVEFANKEIPYDTGVGSQEPGPLMKYINKGKLDEGVPPDLKVDGSGKMAGAAAAELRSEGKV